MIIVSDRELSELYDKAVEMYFECINNDYASLQEEISIPIEQIVLKHSSVKVVFCDNIPKIDSWEVTIILWDESSMIGRYTYIEDDQGNALDDILVFGRKG